MNIFCFIFISVFLFRRSSASGDENFDKFHLPTFVSPLKYDLTINTDPEDEIIDFRGDVRIKIKCTEETNEIIVNRKSLEIEQLKVKVWKLIDDKEDGTVEVDDHDYIWQLDRHVIKLKETLEREKSYVVDIPFFKKIDLNVPFHSFIKRTYESGTSLTNSKPLAYTKLDRFDAREIFPGLDQINLKTPFRMKLGHPKSMKALSNANVDFQEAHSDKPDWIVDVFENTVAMTTFSVTMALLEFVSKKTIEPSSGVEIRVWSDTEKAELIDYVFPVAFHSLKFYFELFQVPYGFKKLDVVILTDEAVKVWPSYGLIILGQEFVTKTIEESRTEYEMASIFSRTISQQWIDYRVTMIWWDQNWLHRGLNRFLQTVCINEIFPEWEFYNSAWDIIDSFVRIQKNETKLNSNPIQTLDEFPTGSLLSENAETQEKIHQLMRMTYFILGAKNFRERIRIYVNTFEFSHSTLPQVWKALGTTPVIEKDKYISESFSVQEVLTSWLSQRGVPLIDVQQDYETNSITVTQVPFLSLPLTEEKEEVNKKKSWIIPVSLTTQNELNFKNLEIRGWLTPEKPLVLHADDMKINRWMVLTLKFNVLGHVTYGQYNWEAIKRCLLDSKKYSDFDVETRVRLIHDIMALAEAEKLTYTFAFNTLKYLKHEKHHLPLKAALDEFDIIYSRLLGTQGLLELFQEYVKRIMKPLYENGGFISLDLVKFFESDYEDYRRKILIVGASCKYGVGRCAEREALSLQKEWKLEKLVKKPQELRKIVLCHSIRYGKTFKSVLFEYKHAIKRSTDWAADIIESACCSEAEENINYLLNMSLNVDNYLYWDHRFRIFESLSTNQNAFEFMKTFFINNYVTIRDMYSNDSAVSTLSYLKILIGMCVNSGEIKELTDFATSMQLKWETRDVEETILKTKKKILWLSIFQSFADVPANVQILKQ